MRKEGEEEEIVKALYALLQWSLLIVVLVARFVMLGIAV